MPCLALAGLLLCAVALPGEALALGRALQGPALPEPALRKAAPAATKPAEPGPAWTADEPEARTCSRSRRKLWQDGEGWVVKAVTVCH